LLSPVFDEDNNPFLLGDFVIDLIISHPRFKVADSSEIDLIIQKVLDDNPEQALRAKTDQKLVQWLVGQIMKAGKGKAPAITVQEKLKNLLT
jgi:Asp-tRNA(Asn)/Glu-tRNA(Gln) amidotransferase B subunit